eukprot:c16054_g1_i1.p1 GENE.c16054_g1_i1~~c16054_g1_i1.p1  ORF type:complete len:249 (-),score=112.42 c16054_g1_i1:26-739(-)
MSKTKVEFFFDVISPYTLLAWRVLKSYEKLWNLEIQLKPIFLGGVMQLTGNRPPAMLASRAKFQSDDIRRNAIFFGVPLLPPPQNFFTEVARNSTQIQRLFLAAESHGLAQEQIHKIVDAFMNAIHLEKSKRAADGNLKINEDFLLTCLQSSGLSKEVAETLVKASNSDEMKAKLKAETEDAVKRGMYGSPTMIFHPIPGSSKEQGPFLVFGSDRFEQTAFILQKEWNGPQNIKSRL